MNPGTSRWRSYAAAAGQMLFLALVVGYVLLLRARLFPAEGVRLSDFQCFWSAAKVALTAGPAKVYDVGAFGDAQRVLLGYADGPVYKFIYTPVSLLLFLPLALLPYTASAVTWLAATAAAYALSLRALLPGWPAVLPFLVFPAAFVNACYVQNGFLSATLLGAATGLLARRPVLAGICFGCFAYKPQLGLVLPLALAAAGRWRAFMAATATAVGLAAAASAAFGAEIWAAFLTGVVGDAGGWLDSTTSRLGSDMPSVFSAVKTLNGGHPGWAYAAQAAAAIGSVSV